jgi:hypothetical protein
MAEAIGAKAIRVMAHLRRNTGRRHISVADAIANAIAVHVPVEAKAAKVTHEHHVRPNHILTRR